MLSVVIPTYLREAELLNTIQLLLTQSKAPAEILVIDQSPDHEPETNHALDEYVRKSLIRWIRLNEPSIPKSMNLGLNEAISPVVLFLDDDIAAGNNLIEAHLMAHLKGGGLTAVAGQVLQPGEVPQDVNVGWCRSGLQADLELPFFSRRGDWIANVMAGNLSVDRAFALRIGGFDESFIGVAYRFETEFARRMIKHCGKIWFCPEASINHLRAARGGTRATGSHLKSADPKYGIGDYYFAFLHGEGWESWSYSFRRAIREIRTKFHLSHPWWIPVKLLGEVRAFLAGWKLANKKKRLRAEGEK